MKSKKSKITNKNNKKSLKKQKGGANNPNTNNFTEEDYEYYSSEDDHDHEHYPSEDEPNEDDDNFIPIDPEKLYKVKIFIEESNLPGYTLLMLTDYIKFFLDNIILVEDSKFIILTNIDKSKDVVQDINTFIFNKQLPYNIIYYIINDNSILFNISGNINTDQIFKEYLKNNKKSNIIDNDLIDKYYIEKYKKFINYYNSLLKICNEIQDSINNDSNYDINNFIIYEYIVYILTNMTYTKTSFKTLSKEKDEIFQWILPSPEIQQLIDNTNNSSAKSPAIKSAPAKSAAIPNNSSSICKLINYYDKMIKK